MKSGFSSLNFRLFFTAVLYFNYQFRELTNELMEQGFVLASYENAVKNKPEPTRKSLGFFSP